MNIEQKYIASRAWGISSSVDLHDCDPKLIRDSKAIQQFVYELCELLKVSCFGECTVVHFGENAKIAGYSMTQLIETSLISGHFANQTNTAYLDIFSCKFYEPDVVSKFSQAFFKAKSVNINYTFRI